jgi:hypothetical protein
MTRVHFVIAEPWMQRTPRRLWPVHPPWVVGDGPLTEADLELARRLYVALDPLSRLWYRPVGLRLGLMVDDDGNLIASLGGKTP